MIPKIILRRPLAIEYFNKIYELIFTLKAKEALRIKLKIRFI